MYLEIQFADVLQITTRWIMRANCCLRLGAEWLTATEDDCTAIHNDTAFLGGNG